MTNKLYYETKKLKDSIETEPIISHTEHMWKCGTYTPWMSPGLLIRYCGNMANTLAKTAIAATDLIYKLARANIESIKQIAKSTRGYYRVSEN